MDVKFKEISFKNLLSFGATKTTIHFSNGINLISGENGTGKSSALLDTLSFCLFGRPYRKINIKDLINRRNKKELLVSCKFTINEMDEYEIIRGLSPDIIRIFKNGVEQDLLSSKKLNQEEIDNILGINLSMFRQIISLAVSYNKPFLSSTAAEKREIIEQFFNITIFGSMLKLLKKQNTDNRSKSELNERSLQLMSQNIISLKRRITEVDEAINNFEKNKKDDLKIIDNRIKTYLHNQIQLKENINKLKSKVKDISNDVLKSLNKEREKVIQEINKNEFDIQKGQEDVNLLENTEICPFCKTKITNTHRKYETKNIKAKIKEWESNIDKLIKKRKDIEKRIEEESEKIKQNREFIYQLKNCEKQISTTETELSQTEERRNEIINRENNINTKSMKDELYTKTKEYNEIKNANEIIKKNLKNNDVVINILSESGIKAYFFKRLVPILNAKINEYIKFLELPVILNFDEQMNEKISSFNNANNEISYFAFSEGEKKRLDMSILLAFIDITKIISNWNCNLLMIDELLDSAVDTNGLDKLVQGLKNMTYENKDLCIYVMSHRLQQEYNSNFSNNIIVHKNSNGFSIINEGG